MNFTDANLLNYLQLLGFSYKNIKMLSMLSDYSFYLQFIPFTASMKDLLL